MISMTTVISPFSTLYSPSASSVGTVTPGQPSASGAEPVDTHTATNMATLLAPPPTADSPMPTTSSSQHTSGRGSNRTLVITLSTVLSVVGVLLITGTVLLCMRSRRRRLSCFARGISPIDDDEIATWKMARGEKASLVGAAAATAVSPDRPGHAKQPSSSSIKKPPSVIIYPSRNSQSAPRRSGEVSPRSMPNSSGSHGKTSFEKDLPRTPVQAVAPNARAGLTDETIPGDEPFLPSPKRLPSRLSKGPPQSSPRNTRTHARTRSSRSSTRSFGEYVHYGSSEMELSPRGSQEPLYTQRTSRPRIYSSSSVPPRLSLSDDAVMGGLSPRPLLLRDNEIGRAIG